MTTQATEMLRALGGNMLRGSGATLGQSGSLDFAQLLEQARAGEIASGVAVRVAQGANVELSSEQLSRLGAAADLAEAHGAARAAFVIDGKLIAMDVPTRTVTGTIDATATGVVNGIDALVTVAAKDAKGAAGLVQPPSALGAQQPMNASLLDALARRSDAAI
jgi:hypothetical protein